MQKINKKIVATISLQEATLTGEKKLRLSFIAIKAEPQIADKMNSNNKLFKGLNLIRNYILFLGVGISADLMGFI